MQQRRKQKKKPVSPPRRGGGPGGKREEEVLKGPKLGGSRNTRQAMRDAMLKAAGTGANGKR